MKNEDEPKFEKLIKLNNKILKYHHSEFLLIYINKKLMWNTNRSSNVQKPLLFDNKTYKTFVR